MDGFWRKHCGKLSRGFGLAHGVLGLQHKNQCCRFVCQLVSIICLLLHPQPPEATQGSSAQQLYCFGPVSIEFVVRVLAASMSLDSASLVESVACPETVTAATLRQAFRDVLQGKDLDAFSVAEARMQVSTKLGFQPDALDGRKKEIRRLLTSLVQELRVETGGLEVQVSLAERTIEEHKEPDQARQYVYMVTISRCRDAHLPDGRPYRNLEELERKDIADAVRKAFDTPLPTEDGRGRPRTPMQESRSEGIDISRTIFIVVFKEKHHDNSVHFHVVVKLAGPHRFSPAKRTLRDRDRLPSHFSCTHTQVWSAMRYLFIETPTKPEVDDSPWQWTADGQSLDLFALSQRPFQAELWRKRREMQDKLVARYERKDEESSRKKAKAVFTKMDLTSVIVSKHLYSKDQLLAYVQDYGTAAMQVYASKHQRRLVADIEDAKEWASAKDNAELEATDEWTMVTRFADQGCPHGESACTYNSATQKIFDTNAGTMDWKELAEALRSIIVNGPLKTTRVPFLVGPSNTGKSTILYPFDDVFSPKRVLHKPAIGSSFGLRNIVNGGKRFIFWDDFRPVEFAHEKTVPVSVFLSLFIGKHAEIQVSQSFNDGNADVQWKKGVVFTGKQEDLWEPTKRVGLEDIRHMRNRCKEFKFLEILEDGSLVDVVPCASCMCKWICRGAAAWDAQAGLQPVLPIQQPPKTDMEHVAVVAGLSDLLAVLQVPQSVGVALQQELEQLGAVHVTELSAGDWERLESWSLLRPLQKRRLLTFICRSP